MTSPASRTQRHYFPQLKVWKLLNGAGYCSSSSPCHRTARSTTSMGFPPVPMVFRVNGRCAASGTGLEARWPGLVAASTGGQARAPVPESMLFLCLPADARQPVQQTERQTTHCQLAPSKNVSPSSTCKMDNGGGHTLRPFTDALCCCRRHGSPPRRLLAACSGSGPHRRLGSTRLCLLWPLGLWLLGLGHCSRCCSCCCWCTCRSSSRGRSSRCSFSSSAAESGDGRRHAAAWEQRRWRSRRCHCTERAGMCLRKSKTCTCHMPVCHSWLPGNMPWDQALLVQCVQLLQWHLSSRR